jgi:NADH:ubiquinone reductase (H+-translocating)
MVKDIDGALTTLPATAQVAAQQGTHLARHLNKLATSAPHPDSWKDIEPHILTSFRYRHLGSFSYVGDDTAVIDLGNGMSSGGLGVFWLWRGAYLAKQVSLRTRVLLAMDWAKKFVFGRDVSRS